MRHWLFLSYARENLFVSDGKLETHFNKFCTDLERELAQRYFFAGGDEKPAFWDRQSLQLMGDWRSDLRQALQTSRVFVCAVSPAYVKKQFCGKEFWLFDSRRREAAGSGPVPKVILPIIWIPVDDPLPAAIASEQFDHGELPSEYREYGLRDLMKRRRTGSYIQCLRVFAKAVIAAGKLNAAIPPKNNVPEFEDMPSAFEPIGPSRARFAFLAADRQAFQGTTRQDRYSLRSRYWKPFNPPVPQTVEEIAEGVAIEQNMAYEELPADDGLSEHLRQDATRGRVILVVDPWTIRMNTYCARVPPPELLDSHRAAVIIPFSSTDLITRAERDDIDRALATAFPRVGSEGPERFSTAPTFSEFRAAVARELSQSHLSAIAAAAAEKPATDTLPVVSSESSSAAARG